MPNTSENIVVDSPWILQRAKAKSFAMGRPSSVCVLAMSVFPAGSGIALATDRFKPHKKTPSKSGKSTLAHLFHIQPNSSKASKTCTERGREKRLKDVLFGFARG